jgi:phosphopantetheine--protein transferase-like protein
MDHVAGCGIDIEELDRFEKIFANNVDGIPGLISDVFSKEEIANNKTGNSLLKFTLGFSCKEAAFKAFGLSWTTSGIYWKDIELLFDKNNPEHHEVKFNGYALNIFKDNGYENIDSSFSYNDLYVVFTIVLLK